MSPLLLLEVGRNNLAEWEFALSFADDQVVIAQDSYDLEFMIVSGISKMGVTDEFN